MRTILDRVTNNWGGSKVLVKCSREGCNVANWRSEKDILHGRYEFCSQKCRKWGIVKVKPTFDQICEVCHISFTSKTNVAKYCDKCRPDVMHQNAKKMYTSWIGE